MASVYDYTFHKSTRIGQDICDLTQQNIQNSAASTYMVDSFVPGGPFSNALNFATSQVDVNFKGGNQVGLGGYNIDENSKLFHTSLSRPKCKISLMERPFATVPYLGKGKRNIVVESDIIQSDIRSNRKSINPSSEVSYLNYSQTPMISSLKNTISNPENLVEGVAADGWVRGGISSREFIRQNEFSNKR